MLEKHHRKPPRLRKIPVTLIIGIICREGIVIASDSATTDTSNGVQQNTQKIHPVPFSNGNTVLVANSGSTESSEFAVRHMQEAAKTVALAGMNAFEVLEKAIGETKRWMLFQKKSPGKSGKATLNELKNIWDQNAYTLMWAYEIEKKKYLYGFDWNKEPGMPKRYKSFGAIGCGDEIAKFLLRDIDCSLMNLAEAATTAIYAVSVAKKLYGACGGPIQVATMISPNDIFIDQLKTLLSDPAAMPKGIEYPTIKFESQTIIDAVERELVEVEQKRGDEWRAKLQDIITRLAPNFNQASGSFTSTTTPP